jgi:Na+/proline symporter
MQSANSLDYFVVGCYAALMVLVGIYVVKFNRGAAEYFRGGTPFTTMGRRSSSSAVNSE